MVRLFVFQVLGFLAARLLQPLADRAGLPALMVVEVQPRRPASTPRPAVTTELDPVGSVALGTSPQAKPEGGTWRRDDGAVRCST